IEPKKYKILDIGCGSGLLSYNLLDIAKEIIGIDTSKGMVEVFNQKSPSPTIRAYQKEITECKEQFDLVVTSMTLHHIPKIEPFFKEVRKRVKKGGYFFICDLYPEDGSFHSRGNEGVFHFGFKPKELEKLLEKEGFEVVSSKTIYTIQKHKNFPLFLLQALNKF
ncbi:MAG: class I SAM-dependent methyltransferase, partial [Epsilonproteobacteria bacterium]|nr:class I SAM-dependent methyltransferase [Campylobacterota bacterium]